MVNSLSVGLRSELSQKLSVRFQDVHTTEMPYDLEALMQGVLPSPSLIVCGVPPEGISPIEVAQMLRMQYQDVPTYLVVDSQSRFDRKNLMKNGFTDVYFLPLDQETMMEEFSGLIKKLQKLGKLFRPVKLFDLQPNSVLEFDTYIYLPANNKHIKYSSAGFEMEKERIERLKNHKVNSLFVAEEDVQKFYDYTAKVLKEIGSDATMSETERLAKLNSSVRELISGLFSDSATGTEGGKKIVEDCQKIIKSYVTSGKANDWYGRILSAIGGSTGVYSHAANVSTYASLFGIALGLQTIEELSLAGLLHDIGMSKIPQEIQEKLPGDWTAAERETYEKHPDFSIEIIKDRKLVLPDLVYKIIIQHHERFNGTGYPHGLGGKRICIEAQVLALADLFDEMTATVPGRPSKDPLGAVKELHENAINDPGKAIVDPELMKRILTLFPAY